MFASYTAQKPAMPRRGARHTSCTSGSPASTARPADSSDLDANICSCPGAAGSYSAAQPPSILHADLDSFYASVEQRDDPDAARPAGDRRRRRRARRQLTRPRPTAVRTAMGGRQARAVSARDRGAAADVGVFARPATAVFEVFHDTTPRGRAASSVDEALPRRGGPAAGVGHPGRDRRPAARATSATASACPITVGIARTKFLAKVASQEAKPDGLLLVPPDRELAFLHPLPVRRLWGVGVKTAEKLHAHGIETVVRRRRAQRVDARVAGRRGDGPSAIRVVAQHRPPPRGDGRAPPVGRGAAGAGPGRQHDDGHGGRRRRRQSRRSNHPADAQRPAVPGRTVVLRLRFDDFGRATRSHTMPRATASTDAILDTARGLVAAAAPLIAERGLTLVGFAVVQHRPRTAPQQLELPFEEHADTVAIRRSASTGCGHRCGNTACHARRAASAATPASRCRTCRTTFGSSTPAALSADHVLTIRSTGTSGVAARAARRTQRTPADRVRASRCRWRTGSRSRAPGSSKPGRWIPPAPGAS